MRTSSALHTWIPALAGFVALALPLVPRPAQACGGTFCDNSGGVPMPVDQRGEDILFIQDGPEIEVHVRIEYQGDAERFAWLVPIQGVPEVSVGSDALFARLAGATAPRWRRQHDYECIGDAQDQGGSGAFVPDDDLAAASEDPDIILDQVVGAFEVVVLQGGSAAELVQFLDANGYAQDPDAVPIVQEYLDEGYLFAAVKLTTGATADSIHPLVFRFAGDEPCVPIRLTRIAAKQDMGIRAYFLGQERWAPLNYRQVILNPMAYPWSETSAIDLPALTELVSLAVDEAGGHAFVTDYAGPSDTVINAGIDDPSWDESVFVGMNMVEAIQAIADQGLNFHPLIQPLLLEFMPPPDGVDAQQFWNNIEDYFELVDFDAWDSAGFAAALAERIIEPGVHASDLLETWPYLTRLQTTLSPHEMTLDPMFQPAPQLGPVMNDVTTSDLDLCGEAGDRYLVPFGAGALPVCLSESTYKWPTALREHPALRIEMVPAVGPVQVIDDFTTEILAAHAASQANTSCGGDGDPTDGGPDTGGTAGGDEGDTGGASLSEPGGKIGCACRSDERGSPLGAVWGLLGLASFVYGGRRRSS